MGIKSAGPWSGGEGGADMEFCLERDGFAIRVSELGAELQSLTAGDREWMWSGVSRRMGPSGPGLLSLVRAAEGRLFCAGRPAL